jgi:hypothetical protein
MTTMMTTHHQKGIEMIKYPASTLLPFYYTHWNPFLFLVVAPNRTFAFLTLSLKYRVGEPFCPEQRGTKINVVATIV